MAWIPRDIESPIRDLVRTRPAIVLTGSRQAGKTSLLRTVFPDLDYVSLDLPAQAQLAEESGETFLARHPPPVVLDEIQYAPRLLHHVKAAIDARRDESGLFLLTGSQKFSLMAGVTESLAGRAAVVECLSLSALEIERWRGTPIDRGDLAGLMFAGGYPELHARSLEPGRFYSDYVATYLERDVRQALAVRSLREFNRFMRLAASRTGQLLSLNSFAADLGISPNTVKSWLSVLEASNVVRMLEPYHRNLGKRLVKRPKLYFTDTGLACFLVGLRSPVELERSELLGPMFETHVLGQILRWYANRSQRAPVSFYRDHHGHEVDFVIPVGEKLKLIECNWTETPTTTTRGFEEITGLVGESDVVSRTLITPARGCYTIERTGVFVDDSIELSSLAV